MNVVPTQHACAVDNNNCGNVTISSPQIRREKKEKEGKHGREIMEDIKKGGNKNKYQTWTFLGHIFNDGRSDGQSDGP